MTHRRPKWLQDLAGNSHPSMVEGCSLGLKPPACFCVATVQLSGQIMPSESKRLWPLRNYLQMTSVVDWDGQGTSSILHLHFTDEESEPWRGYATSPGRNGSGWSMIHTWAAFILEHTVLNIQLGIPSAVKLFYNFQNVATHFLTIIPVLCVHIISNSFSSIMSVPSVWPYPWFWIFYCERSIF